MKFALLDKVAGPISEHFLNYYLRPAWIEFIVVAYITGLTAVLSQGRSTPADIWVFFAVPALCFVTCLVLVFGFPKAHIESATFQVYLPFVITTVSLAISGGRIGT